MQNFENKYSIYFLYAGLLLYLGLWLYTIDFPFFWDTVQLSSRQASYFYFAEKFNLILPNEIDSGHFPAMGIYLSSVWKLFGRTLIASHLAMLPFIVAFPILLHMCLRLLLNPEVYLWIYLIILLDPTILAQATLVSPDFILVNAFIALVYSYLKGNKLGIVLCSMLLASVSMRGTILLSALFVGAVIFSVDIEKKKRALWAAPALILMSLFLFYHYSKTSWIFYHENSPWALQFTKSSFAQWPKNIAVLIWRLVDFGRIAWILILLICLWPNRKAIASNWRIWGFLLFITVVVCSPALRYLNINSHRYFAPAVLILAFMLGWCLEMKPFAKIQKIALTVSLILIAAGHLLIYPKSIAKGWDASLAYLNFPKLSSKMYVEIKDLKLDSKNIAAQFPINNTPADKDLNGDYTEFKDFYNFNAPYVIYTNLNNDFTDQQLRYLQDSCIELKKWVDGRVYIKLYQVPQTKYVR